MAGSLRSSPDMACTEGAPLLAQLTKGIAQNVVKRPVWGTKKCWRLPGWADCCRHSCSQAGGWEVPGGDSSHAVSEDSHPCWPTGDHLSEVILLQCKCWASSPKHSANISVLKEASLNSWATGRCSSRAVWGPFLQMSSVITNFKEVIDLH